MRKFYLPLSVVYLVASFLLLPVVKAGNYSASGAAIINTATYNAGASSVDRAGSLLYDSLKLNKIGLNKQALMYAYRGLHYLAQKRMLNNPDILTVCDFSQSSGSKRLYVIDIKKFKVLLNTFVAHGKNSGLNYANRFSNKPSSLESSLGFYVTRNTYFGEHGLSLRLSGLEKGYNDKAESRAIVVHGAEYIGEGHWDASYMGRSFGCPAVPQQIAAKVINLIKDGTCLFIYHPSRNYLHGSRILNG